MTAVTEPIDATQVAGGIAGKSPRRLAWERFRRDRGALVGLAVILVLGLVAIFAGVIARHLVGHGPNDLYETSMLDEFGLPLGPNGSFWFGADTSGRDLFVRVLYGTRTALAVGVISTAVAVALGSLVGLLAGYYRGVADMLLSRLTDVVLALPVLLLAIGVVAACGTSKEGCAGGLVKPGLTLVIVVVALFSWPFVARIVRGTVLSLREQAFVEAARSLGAGGARIMARELLPNLAGPIAVYATLLVPSTILFEAALSYLGLGVPDRTPSWGRMLADASPIFDIAWWLMLFPGLFLLATTLAFNLVGDGLRDALDPRSRR